MDHALARAAQPVYLPNVPLIHEKSGTDLRGFDGEPLYHERASSDLAAPALPLARGPIASAIAEISAQREADQRDRERIRREAEARRASKPIGQADTIIGDFNAANSVATMLEMSGYQQSPRDPADWRSPNQAGDTYATRIIDTKWISLSSSDAGCGIGDRCASGCYGDAYDLFVHYQHGGDHKAAFRALHAERRDANVVYRDWGTAEPPSRQDGDPGWQEDDLAAEDEESDAVGDDLRSGVRLDDFRAYMPSHSYIFMPSGEMWPASSVNARIAPLSLTGKRGEPLLDDKGKPKKLAANQWLDQHRPVEQLTWAPGEPQVVRDRLISNGGWVERPDCNIFNLYRPPAALDGDAAMAVPWIEHVRRVYPEDAERLIRWLAHRVQRPQEKINHAIVMGGAQGVGKDTILEPVNFADVSPQHLLGRFNDFVKSVIMRVSEARGLGDVDRFAFYDHMKTYTSAPPDVLRVDEKHVREYSVFNVCSVIITTNHKGDGIYLPPDDRRHYVAWSSLTRDDFPDGYWQSLWAWYRDGGIGHVAAYLRDLDLSNFDAKAPPAKTAAFWDIVSANAAPEDAELADALDSAGTPDAVTIATISAFASDDFRTWLADRRNSRRIPHRLEQCGYVALRNGGAKDGLYKVMGRRCAVYALKTFATRDAVVAAERLIRG